MKYIFFGTPEFASRIIEKLVAAGMPPAAIVANPDRPTGRKKILTAPPTKIIGEKNGIPVYQPESLADLLTVREKLAADFFVVAAYSKIIPQRILEIPRLGTIGVHPSLLPRYRGASPIQSALIAGERETGVALYHMDAKVDHGPILSSHPLLIDEHDTYETLMRKLSSLGGDLLTETIPRFFARAITPKTQDDGEATSTRKFNAEDGYVAPKDFDDAVNGTNPESARAIERKIRALNPEPGVWTTKNGKRMKLLNARILNGALYIETFQIEGKKPQTA